MENASAQELLERAIQTTKTLFDWAKDDSDEQMLLLQITFMIVGAKNAIMRSPDEALRKPPVTSLFEEPSHV